MQNSTRRPIPALICALLLLLPASALAFGHGIVENFATKLHCDRTNTTANWDTVGRALRLPALAPAIVGSLATTSARGAALAGDYAYVADYTSGLRVINISNPSSPTLTSPATTRTSRTAAAACA